MAVKLRRPILVGGVGLSFALWFWQSLHHSIVQWGEFAVLGAVAVGGGFWFLQQKTAKTSELPSQSPLVNREMVEKAITQTETLISQLETEANNTEVITQLRQQLIQTTAELDRKELNLAITGGKSVGKTSLLPILSNCLPKTQQQLNLKETPALFVTNAESETTAKAINISSDLVLFVTAGDLTQTEFEALQELRATNQRIILILNKQDQFLPTERVTILQQLRTRMTWQLVAEDVVGIAANPALVKVRKHQTDDSVQEWIETQQPDVATLSSRLTQILATEGQQLILATALRATVALQAEVKTRLNNLRRDRALPIIEQYQWISAAAAFANPVPALDLLATAAISGQLVVELGEIYQQKFSMQQAQTTAKTLGSLMLKLGLVELSTQAIGGILKSNAFTYVAGGAVQGVSAAYLTRLAGLSLIEYLEEQDYSDTATDKLFNLERLGQKLQLVFQQNQRQAIWQGFVKATVARISPTSSLSTPTS
jgi:GTPase SAR1 family protein